MYTPPSRYFTEPLVISTLAFHSGGVEQSCYATGLAASAVWPAASLAIFVPLYLPRPMTVVKVYWINGATVNGNTDMAVYSEDGQTKHLTSGATAQSGTSVIQVVDITDTVLPGPARYYMALYTTSAGPTATYFRKGTNVNLLKAMGCAQQGSISTNLPSTITLAAFANSYCPVFGISGRVTL